MMLDHLGQLQAAADVMTAIEHALASDTTRTQDLGGVATTQECTAAMLSALSSMEL
jgi:tartrate dehydrogenase/decarboxylase/D-malate dehydrogenase